MSRPEQGPEMPRDLAPLPAPLVTMLDGLRGLIRHDPLLARSRKISARGISAERFLMTFPRDWLPDTGDPRPLAALIESPLPDALTRAWRQADMLHLGLDAADPLGGCMRKLYLEFAPDRSPAAGLAFLAVKAGREARLHRYETVPDPAAVLAALALPDALALPAMQVAGGSDALLRVSEAATDRLSLDIGLVDRAPDAPTLEALHRMVTAVNPDAAPPALWPSHVAVGRDRQGMPFVTLYGWPDGATP